MQDRLENYGEYMEEAPEFTFAFDLEFFEGTLLAVLTDENDQLYIEKWCTCTTGTTIQRALVVPTTVEAILSYLRMECPMLDLLQPEDDSGFLIDHGTGGYFQISRVKVSTLPEDYFPDADALHDPELRTDSTWEFLELPGGTDVLGRPYHH